MLKGYIKKMRSKLGSDTFIYPSARIIIENNAGEFLFIERVDNGNLGLPAGGMEENETIEQCIIREVKEETGLSVKNVQVIGISSNPELEKVTYSNGDVTQYFTIEFYSKTFEGKLSSDGIETKNVGFRSSEHIHKLPRNERMTFQSLIFFKKHQQINLR